MAGCSDCVGYNGKMARIATAPPYILTQARKLVAAGEREPRSLHLSWLSNWGLSLRWWDERKYAFLIYDSEREVSAEVQKWIKEAFSQAYGKPFVGQGTVVRSPRERGAREVLPSIVSPRSSFRLEDAERPNSAGTSCALSEGTFDKRSSNETVPRIEERAVPGPNAQEEEPSSSQGVYFFGGAPKEVPLASVTFPRLDKRNSME